MKNTNKISHSQRIHGLYVIVDNTLKPDISHEDIASAVIRAGARVIQLRAKDMPPASFKETAIRIRKMMGRKCTLIINDSASVAVDSNADGLHLGQDDMDMGKARSMLGDEKIIGISTHNMEQALRAVDKGADYIALGPIFPTQTKAGIHPLLGPKFIKKVKGRINLPIIAIGGITADNLYQVLDGGADGIAVISAIVKDGNIYGNTVRLLERIDEYHKLLATDFHGLFNGSE